MSYTAQTMTESDAKEIAAAYVAKLYNRPLCFEAAHFAGTAWIVGFTTGTIGIVERCAVNVDPNTKECRLLTL